MNRVLGSCLVVKSDLGRKAEKGDGWHANTASPFQVQHLYPNKSITYRYDQASGEALFGSRRGVWGVSLGVFGLRWAEMR